MNNKVIVKLVVPEINTSYNVLLPINKKIGTIVGLLNKAINELSQKSFPINNTNKLYNAESLELYDNNKLLYNTDIRNGTRLVILSK